VLVRVNGKMLVMQGLNYDKYMTSFLLDPFLPDKLHLLV